MKRGTYLSAFFAFLFMTITLGTVRAAVKLPHLLSSNMVLQRGAQTSVWGWSNPGERISVTFRGTTVKTKGDKEGKWLVKIKTGDAGGPFDLSITGDNIIVLKNVLVGDVWVCSGQSNMEWPLIQAETGPADVRKADHKDIRLFTVQNNTAVNPLDDVVRTKWEVCSPETVKQFSAVGYYFGRKIHIETGVPIGLISSNWGGTNVETWSSEDVTLADPITAEGVNAMKKVDFESIAKNQHRIFEAYQKVLKEVQKPEFTHSYLLSNTDESQWTDIQLPQLWENVSGFGFFDGIVWFRKTIDIPTGFNLANATLNIGKIDDSDITWINGRRVGETYNQYNLLRSYNIQREVLRHGKNLLVVRVEDYTGGGGIYGSETDLYLTDGAITVDLSGKWKMIKDETPTPMNPVSPAASVLQPNQYPSLLFNGMINPLLNHAIKGVIWYQGESNADAMQQALRYEMQLRKMINDWRAKWGVGNFPFYMVQLANYKNETHEPVTEVWPFLREAQANLSNEDKIGMACIIDIGDAADIHPKNKLDVGERLALNALKFDYGKDVIYCGPRKKQVDFNGDKALVTFYVSNDGLKLKNKYGYVNGFSVAGPDKVFHYAKASLVNNNQVEVSCSKVEDIKSVRFLWADNPGAINLFNSSGLPAEPFRTDNW